MAPRLPVTPATWEKIKDIGPAGYIRQRVLRAFRTGLANVEAVNGKGTSSMQLAEDAIEGLQDFIGDLDQVEEDENERR